MSDARRVSHAKSMGSAQGGPHVRPRWNLRHAQGTRNMLRSIKTAMLLTSAMAVAVTGCGCALTGAHGGKAVYSTKVGEWVLPTSDMQHPPVPAIPPPLMLPPEGPAWPQVVPPGSGSAVGAVVTVDPLHGTRVYEFRQGSGIGGSPSAYSRVHVQPGPGQMVGIGVSSDSQHGTRMYRYYQE